ncbi:MAG: peptidylprolyl isomerase [Anaerolineales bacterium]|nr:peptidylprolyl isomerase [Anaerolineales bacterium]MBS3752039.1 peptidylprolyl isomerase [Anaerolineales bacterium]
MTKEVQEDMVVSLDYTLIVDDDEVESTQDGNPIQFIQGHGQIIPGLEEALSGMEVDSTKTIHVKSEDAYGESDPDARQKVKKEEFSEDVPLDVGTFLDLRDADDNVLSAQIVEKDEETVTLDFNHPLAGKDLVFEVTIADLRPATEEEIEHGHVHES